MVSEEMCIAMLHCMDGLPASRELATLVRATGAREFHAQASTALLHNGWWINGHVVDYDLRCSPHLRRWELLVDGQRKPLLELQQAPITVTDVYFEEANDNS